VTSREILVETLERLNLAYLLTGSISAMTVAGRTSDRRIPARARVGRIRGIFHTSCESSARPF